LPEGYPRRLSSPTAIGKAMDRLYREIRSGMVSPDMGRILFNILTRILDTRLNGPNADVKDPKRRSKVDRMRPKLEELLVQVEQTARQQKAAETAAGRTDQKAGTPEGEHATSPDPAQSPSQDDRAEPSLQLVTSHAS